MRKFCGKLQKFRGNLWNMFCCTDPFPNDPISELVKCSQSAHWIEAKLKAEGLSSKKIDATDEVKALVAELQALKAQL